ncbi:MAG TPA: MBL fold metallo-hydrolase [Actinomycetes bacterium]|jgi:ribonuclease BN (tRNA processing enzyme)|nr:MBL fold metallo-hydrolase [Actinomycetes bacterium]
MQVKFVGSGDAFGNGGRFQACILLRAPGHADDVLLDCGASSLVALKQQRCDPARIGLVLVSHLHGDHFGGVPFLVLDGQFTHRTRPLHVAGPAGVGERVQAAMEVLFPGSTQVQRRFEVQFHELADRQPFQFDVGVDVERAGLVVTPYEVVHASGAAALALRVGWQGHTIAYTGDTEWTEVLVEVAQGADLLIAEGYTYQRKIRFHLDVATLQQQAGRLGARRIVLTHLSPDLLSRVGEVGWETARDGMTVELEG